MSVSLRARAALVLAVCCVGLAPTSGPYRPRPSPTRLELYFTRVKKQGPIDRPGCPRAATSRPLPTGSLPGRGLGSAVRHSSPSLHLAASSGWVLIAQGTHDPAPVSQPHTALLTQISTHAVHLRRGPRLSGAGLGCATTASPAAGRGPLHRRRSRVEGKQMHSTTAQPSSRQRPCPYQPSCRPVLTSGATLDGHRVRRNTGACARLEEAPAPS